MPGLGWQHLLLFALVVFLLFGKGRLSDIMGDAAKGIKSFKKGLADDDETPSQPTTRLQSQQPIEPNKSADLQPMKDDRPHA